MDRNADKRVPRLEKKEVDPRQSLANMETQLAVARTNNDTITERRIEACIRWLAQKLKKKP